MRVLTKVLRDLWLTRRRAALMVLALAAGLTSMGAMLSIRTVVDREMTRNYMDSVPASATFDVGEGGLPDALLAALRQRPEVAWAERRSTRELRWHRPGATQEARALLFVIEDFEGQRIARLGHEPGQRARGAVRAWGPHAPRGSRGQAERGRQPDRGRRAPERTARAAPR